MTAAQENAPTWQGRGADAYSVRAGHEVKDTPVAVDVHEAQRFLTLLDETGESWHFRTFDDRGRGAGRNYAGTLDSNSAALQLDNGKGRGVFVVVGEGGQTDPAITRVRAVFADFDPPKTSAMPERFPIEPHIIVESSPGKHHAYWLVDGLPVESFTPTQQAIAVMLGSDPAVCNPSRVMRLPGFVHHKGSQFRARIVHESGELPYAAGVLCGAFPAVARDTPRNVHTAGAGDRVVDHERHGDLLKMAARGARSVHFDGMAAESALAALYAEAERGRWTREMPSAEIRAAFDGALAKCRSGEWRKADQPDEENDGAHLVEVSVSGLLTAEAMPPRFIAGPIIPRSVVTLLGGHGGSGKTVLALTWLAHAACGRDWGGFPFERCKGAFVSLEDPGDKVRFRLRRVIEAYRLDADLVEANLRVFDGTQGDPALVTEVAEAGTRRLSTTPAMLELEEAVAGAELIVVDNASDGFDGNENDRRQVRMFVRRLASIAQANDAGLILLAHIDKHAARYNSAGNSYSGSTAWHNSARSRMALIDVEGVLELVHEKCNLAKKADPLRLVWDESGVLMPTQVTRETESVGADLLAKADADHVLEVVRTALASGITVPTGSSGPSTAWHALSHLPELGSTYRAKDGKRRVHAALIRLGREGRLVRATWQTPSRNVRECWQLTQAAGSEAPKSAADISPNTPSALTQRRGRSVVTTPAPTHATDATDAEGCPRCDGEGCAHCRPHRQ